MSEVFTWLPDDGPVGDIRHRVRKVPFGDGYTQRIPDGLNTKEQRWPLTFNRDYLEIDAIESFLDAHGGHTPFLWTPPGPSAVEGYYVCDQWTRMPRSGSQAILSATFEQAPQP
jgi:phage-related protein